MHGLRCFVIFALCGGAFALQVNGQVTSPPLPNSVRVLPEPVNVSDGGTLRIVFAGLPPGRIARWRLVGSTEWRVSELGGLDAGDYLVEFEPVNGVAPAARVATIKAGRETELEVAYPEATDADLPQGAVSVVLRPEIVGTRAEVEFRGQWRPVGTSGWLNSGDVATGLGLGPALLEFKTLPSIRNYDFVAPPRTAVSISEGTTRLGATYTRRTRIAGAQLPTVRTVAEVTGSGPAAEGPWQFAGQIQTDSGSGSGVAVDTRVVLTAAHVVFDEAALSFATGVRWLHQRVRDQFEPAPLFARGFYVARGYAEGRKEELTRPNDPSDPGEESEESQERDVATLYFREDCARGGRSGYLRVDQGRDFLAGPGKKTILGYPTEAVTGDGGTVSEADFGKLFSTAPQEVAFAQRNATSRVYSTTQITGVGGMSGGPVFVDFDDGRSYPAGIYLGGASQAFVRAIDAQAEGLILLGRASGKGQDNDGGQGGSIRVENDVAYAEFAVGSLQVFLDAPPALSSQTRWHLAGQTYRSGQKLVGLRASRQPYVLEFEPVPGLETPAPRKVVVDKPGPQVVVVSYTQLRRPVFRFPALPPAAVGVRYMFELSLEGTPLSSFRATGLEGTGLSLEQDPKTKQYRIEGTPVRTAEELKVSFTAKNRAGISRAEYSLRISNPVAVNFSILNAVGGSVRITPAIRGRNLLPAGPTSLPLVPGATYVLTAVPRPGFVFSNWSGVKLETEPVLELTPTGPGDLTATFIRNPYVRLRGNFGGILRQPAFSPATSGYVAVTLARLGSYTARITLGGKRYALRGGFNGAGEASKEVPLASGGGVLKFNPRVGTTDENSALMTGTVEVASGSSSAPPLRFAIEAPRQARLPGLPRRMSLILPIDPAHAGDSATEYPRGEGYAALDLDARGNVIGVLRLGDGTKVSTTGFFARDGKWRFYAPLFEDGGAVIAEIGFGENESGRVDYAKPLRGRLEWARPPGTPGRGFFRGFTARSEVIGERWLRRPAGERAADVFGWNLVFGGGTVDQPIRLTATLTRDDRFFLIGEGARQTRISFDRATGVLRGSILLEGRRVPFGASLLQQQMRGGGFLILPNGSTAPVTLLPPELGR
jgi:hypothetical protein